MGEYGDPNLARNPDLLKVDLEKARKLVEDKTNAFVACYEVLPGVETY